MVLCISIQKLLRPQQLETLPIKHKQLAFTEDLHKSRWEGKEEELENELRKLFSYNEEKTSFSEEELNNIVKYLNECKILDPACGSGAFPMGILHKMVHVLKKKDCFIRPIPAAGAVVLLVEI